MLDPFFGKSDAAIVFLNMSNALRRVNHTHNMPLACCVKHNNHNIETTTEHRKLLSSDIVVVVG